MYRHARQDLIMLSVGVSGAQRGQHLGLARPRDGHGTPTGLPTHTEDVKDDGDRRWKVYQSVGAMVHWLEMCTYLRWHRGVAGVLGATYIVWHFGGRWQAGLLASVHFSTACSKSMQSYDHEVKFTA